MSEQKVSNQYNTAGNIVWKENYRPFGEKLTNQTAAADNRLGFHGKAVDTDTGLQYFGARYYDPVLGRFMGVDPVGFQEDNIHSFNKYAYGNNNPYRFIDPNGKYAELVLEAVSITVGFKSLIENARAGNYRSSLVDAGGIVADLVGAALPGIPGIAGLGIKASRDAADQEAQIASKVFSKEKQAIVDMAKSDKKSGVTQADMKAYEALNKGLKDPFPANMVRTDKGHLKGAPHSQVPHGHVGPIDHIPIVNP